MEAATQKPRAGRPPKCGGCGECDRCARAAYMREWYGRFTPEERAEKRRSRNPVLVREQDRRKMQRRRTAGTPKQKQRIRARADVRLAIDRGDLERGPCVACGGEENVHGHHDDYEKPLDVVWLCRPHHDQLHEWMGAF